MNWLHVDSSDTIMLVVHGAPTFTTQTSKVSDKNSWLNYTAYCHLQLLAGAPQCREIS